MAKIRTSLHGRVVGVTDEARIGVLGQPYTVTFSPAAGSSNVCEVTITVKDYDGNTVAGTHMLDIWLSDAASGAGLTGTSASGAVAAKAASGVDFQIYSAKKAWRVQTLATGVYILSITDSAKTAFYPCASIDNATVVGTVLATANYGA
jgi:hypothetical protein